MKYTLHVTSTEQIRNTCNISVRRTEGKISLGKPRCTWEDNTIINLRDIGWKVVDWIHMAQVGVQWRARFL